MKLLSSDAEIILAGKVILNLRQILRKKTPLFANWLICLKTSFDPEMTIQKEEEPAPSIVRDGPGYLSTLR